MEASLIDQLISFRKELHKHAELSQQEHKTQELILTFLSSLNIEAEKIAGTGVYVVFDSGNPGKTVMLRSDHDGLPIRETNTFDHTSKTDGISHKCGHDGHTSILAGVAAHFKAHPLQKGKLILIFQPAEENGVGAKAVLNDAAFSWKPDFVFAMHNLPGYPKGELINKEGNFTAAAKSIIIRLTGKTAHAAEPEKGVNPAAPIAELIQMFDACSQPDFDRDDFALATPIHLSMGEKSYGISAGYGEVHYTLRTWNRETMNPLTDKILQEVARICNQYNIEYEIEFTEEFASNRNDPQAVSYIRQAAESLKTVSKTRERPFKWGEDFGLFTQRFKGAMFGVGAGEDCAALHNPDYDFPDDITETSIQLFVSIVEKVINE